LQGTKHITLKVRYRMPREDTPPTSVSDQFDSGDDHEEMSEEEMSDEGSEMSEYRIEQKFFVEVTDAGVAVSCCRSLADFVGTETGKQFVSDLYDINVVNRDDQTRKDRRTRTITLVNEAARVGLPVEHFEAGGVEGFCSVPPENWSEVGAEEWQATLKGDVKFVPESVQGTASGWEYALLPEGETGLEGCKGYMRKFDPVSGVESRWEPNLEGCRAQEGDRIE
jgi:hypothetical protein